MMWREALSIRRKALASVALTTLLAGGLAACNQQTAGPRGDPTRGYKPLAAAVQQELAGKGMSQSDPILVRIYKEESELEVWKKAGGRYQHFKTYPICKWSGELGPKKTQGDRQAPEGFYTITPGQMNPNSNYYLAFNLGFPNSYDRAFGRDGSFLMVHGDCSSMGCYAMTDAGIAEVYALAREALNGGQRNFQVQALPFRMTAKNLARHRANPNMAFWKNLKEGTDYFAVTQLEPKVDVCGRRYAFNTAGSCGSSNVGPETAAAVAQKAHQDDVEVAELSRTSPVSPVRYGLDGGKHTSFGGIQLASYNLAPASAAPAVAAPVQVAAAPVGVKPTRLMNASKPAPKPAEAEEAAVAAAAPAGDKPTVAAPAAAAAPKPTIGAPGTMAFASTTQSPGWASKLNPTGWFAKPSKEEPAADAAPVGAPMPLTRQAAVKVKRKAADTTAEQ